MGKMRCSVFIGVSLDGFIARANGEIDWLDSFEVVEPQQDFGYKEFYSSVDTLIVGRGTFEVASRFKAWPYEGKRVVVLSSGMDALPPELSGKAEIMSAAPTDVVRTLDERGARHAYVDGGRTIQGFLRAGLIDDMTITRLPILLGAGLPLFGSLDRDVRLDHIQTRAYKNGFVQSKYGVLLPS